MSSLHSQGPQALYLCSTCKLDKSFLETDGPSVSFPLRNLKFGPATPSGFLSDLCAERWQSSDSLFPRCKSIKASTYGAYVPTHCGCVRLFVTLWPAAPQAPLSMGSCRLEYWSGLHALLQGFFPTQGWNPSLLRLLHCRQILRC